MSLSDDKRRSLEEVREKIRKNYDAIEKERRDFLEGYAKTYPSECGPPGKYSVLELMSDSEIARLACSYGYITSEDYYVVKGAGASLF